VSDHATPLITRFMIERHGWETASIAETFAAAHLIAREDDGAKLWADVAEQAKRFLARPLRVSMCRGSTSGAVEA